MKDFWNERYAEPEYAYGEVPNHFLSTILPKIKPGDILFPAEGEGRNAVFAASLGWNVEAFDLSESGKQKALRLADRFGVSIDYHVGEFREINLHEKTFDGLGLFFAHFPAQHKPEYHQVLSNHVRSGGFLVFEAFSKNHLYYREKNPKAGGPANIDMLFSTEELRSFFPDFNFELLEEKVVELKEGSYHVGESSVVRAFGTKR